MKSMLIMEVNRILNHNGRDKKFEDLDLTDFTLHYSTVAQLDLFIITDTLRDQYRVMKIRRDVSNCVREGMEYIEKDVAYLEDFLNDHFSDS